MKSLKSLTIIVVAALGILASVLCAQSADAYYYSPMSHGHYSRSYHRGHYGYRHGGYHRGGHYGYRHGGRHYGYRHHGYRHHGYGHRGYRRSYRCSRCH